jgi:methylmalonyl-CoA/ethylmalonyl-CoA epimerase
VPPPLRLDHVTAIVPDAGALSRVLTTVVGMVPSSSIELPGMRILTFRLGDVELHVNQPTGAGPVADALARSGSHLHHLAFAVDDLDATLVRLGADGIEPMGAPVATAPGLREVFLKPEATAGLFVQLVERGGAEVAHTLDADAVDALARVGEEVKRI